MPREGEDRASVENAYVDIVKRVRDQISLPIAMKIGPYFTSLSRVHERSIAPVPALVLFNRFYSSTSTPKSSSLPPGYQFSSPGDPHRAALDQHPQRRIRERARRFDRRFSPGSDVMKMLLAGATAVQVCSTVYERVRAHQAR